MPVTRLMYFSENQIDPAQGSAVRELNAILTAANRNNKALGLTGALVFDDRWFLQILEGERAKVWELFERIRDDERHANITLAEMIEVPDRTFGNWWMGLATRTADTQSIFAPFLVNGFFDPRPLRSAQMLSLAIALAHRGLQRKLASAEAASPS